MLPAISKLLVIQHRDQNIAKLKAQIARLPIEEEDIRDRISGERKAVEDALADTQAVEVEIKNIELDVQTRRDSIAKLKVQQFETKKNEEFRTMGEEIERYEKEVTELEDQELEQMEKLEGLNSILKEKRSLLAESEDTVEEDIKNLANSKSNWEAEQAEEQAERDKLAAEIDEDLLEIYDRLFESKKGKAVVGLENMQCSGCHMKVVKSTVITAKAANEVAYCENCGRILYYWTDESDNEKGSSNEY